MKPAESSSKEKISFAIKEQNSGIILDSVIDRVRDNIIAHIKQSTDIVLVTSINRETTANFVDELSKKLDHEIRSLSLRGQDLLNMEDGGEGSNENDFGLISSIIYESIQLDEHLLISIYDADKLPIETFNKLVSLALITNSKKNNIIFMFSGGPDLLSQVEQISNIRRLSIAHCTLDDLMPEDLVEFISTRQGHLEANEQYEFEELAIKTIVTHASGSLYKAAILLEWCREYCDFKQSSLASGALVIELLSILLNKSQAEGTNLFSSYPTANYNFNALPDLEPNALVENGAPEDPVEFSAIESNDKISVQVVGEKSKKEAPNVFERAMTDASESELILDKSKEADKTIHAPTTEEFNGFGQIESSNIEHIVVETKDSIPFDEELDDSSIELIEKFSALDDSRKDSVKFSEKSKPLHIENTDLSLTRLVPKHADKSVSLSSLQWTFIILIIGAILFYAGIMFIASQGNSDLPTFSSIADEEVIDGTIQEAAIEPEQEIIPGSMDLSIEEIPIEQNETKITLLERIKSIGAFFGKINETPDESNIDDSSPTMEGLPEIVLPQSEGSPKEQSIQSLLVLAQEQMQSKHLTTPPSDNAFETYKMVLQFDPKNEKALSGIESIRMRYLIWAEQQVIAGNSSQAKYYLDQALEISNQFSNH